MALSTKFPICSSPSTVIPQAVTPAVSQTLEILGINTTFCETCQSVKLSVLFPVEA